MKLITHLYLVPRLRLLELYFHSPIYLHVIELNELITFTCLNRFHGRAIAQAVSHRPPTMAARVWTQVRSCGICIGRSGTGAGFLRVLRFPLPILIPPIAPHVIITRYTGILRQIVADVPSGLSLTPPQAKLNIFMLRRNYLPYKQWWFWYGVGGVWKGTISLILL
jgi:hypothetical protein